MVYQKHNIEKPNNLEQKESLQGPDSTMAQNEGLQKELNRPFDPSTGKLGAEYPHLFKEGNVKKVHGGAVEHKSYVKGGGGNTFELEGQTRLQYALDKKEAKEQNDRLVAQANEIEQKIEAETGEDVEVNPIPDAEPESAEIGGAAQEYKETDGQLARQQQESIEESANALQGFKEQNNSLFQIT